MKITNDMKLYHGTNCYFENIDLSCAKPSKDFGRGFYLTSYTTQAIKWARRSEASEGYVYEYIVNHHGLSELKVLELLHYNKEWIDFITQNRVRRNDSDYDLIYDKIADNQYKEISKTLFEYHKEYINYEDAIKKIQWKNSDGDQFCFKTEKALSKIERIATYIQYKDSTGKWKVEKR
jgi:hypothetical protein